MILTDIQKKILDWEALPPQSRNYDDGLALLVEASRNRMFLFTLRNPEAKKEFIDYQLHKYVADIIMDSPENLYQEPEGEPVQPIDEQPAEYGLEQAVDRIIKDNISLVNEKEDVGHKGRRDDHERLPDEIKALYIENLDLLHQIRNIHVRLTALNEEQAKRPRNDIDYDAERRPLMLQIIDLDKKMHEYWKRYDSFVFKE